MKARGSKSSWIWSALQFACLAAALTASDRLAAHHRWLGNICFVVSFCIFAATFYGRRTDVGRGEALLFSGLGALTFAVLVPVLWHDPIVILIVPGCIFFLVFFLVLARGKPRQGTVQTQ